MISMSFTGLINNVALLLAMGVVYGMAASRLRTRHWSAELLSGFFLGVVGISLMMNPWTLAPGVIFDARSILLSVGGLFLGLIPMIFAVVMSCLYRLHEGGPGAFTGCAVIITSGLIGWLWARFRRRPAHHLSGWEYYLFGFVVHINMLLWMLSLPNQAGPGVLEHIALPVMLIFPVGTVLFAKLLAGLDRIYVSESAVRASEKEFRDLAESMPQIVWATRADGWTTYFNQQWVDYTGMTLEESYGDGWNKPFHPDDRKRAWEAWQNATENQTDYSLECRLRRFDGTYHWWLIRGVPQLNAAGETVKWFGTCTDVEQVKQAESALRESEEKYRALFENAPLAYQSLDEAGRFVDVNPAWLQMLGYARDEVIGHSFRSFLHPDFVPHFDTNFPAFKKRGYVSGAHFRIRRKDGTFRSIELNGCIGYHPDGSVRQTYCVFQDITERLEAEQKLGESERDFRAMIESLPLAIYFSRGVEEVCEYLNPTFISLFGYTLEEVPTAADWFPLAYPDPDYRKKLVDEWSRRVQQAIENHSQIEPMEAVVTCKDGSRKTILWGYKTMGEKSYAYGLDLTDRKQAEGELAEQLDELRRWRDVMVGREERLIEIKKEVNELLARLGEPPRYASATEPERT